MKHTRRSLIVTAVVLPVSALFAQVAPASKPPADLAGKWEFVFQTDDGTRTFQAEFKLDGKAVTGTWGKDAEVKGTFEDGKLDLEFPMTSEEVGQGTLKLTGKLSDLLTGSWSFQSYSGSFKATRIKTEG